MERGIARSQCTHARSNMALSFGETGWQNAFIISECTRCHRESLWSSGQQPQSGQGLHLCEMQELCVGICGEHLHQELRQEQQSDITDT